MSPLSIVLGLHLDGQRPAQAATRLGYLVTGPQGFLDVLETHLGLLAEYPAHSERVMRYRDALASSDTPDRFYHASFATDALGVSEALLKWRDLWYLHGWTGKAEAGSPMRLKDMALVEQIASDTVGHSVGERLLKVLERLAYRTVPIGEIQLLESLERWPRAWQGVLDKLPHSVYNNDQAGVDEPATLLSRLQRALRAAADGEASTAASNPLAWEADGSVIIARAQTSLTATSWIASVQEGGSTLFVSDGDGTRLDDQLEASGLARQGFRDSNAARPALQVLPLALELLWDPLDVGAVVEFLRHPVCPLRAFARKRLAATIADKPGLSGRHWDKTLEAINAHYGEDAAVVREQIQQWLLHRRHPVSTGASVDAVVNRVRAVADFFQARLNDENDTQRTAYVTAYAQCRACLAALQTYAAAGIPSITQRQLQIVIHQATGNGTAHPGMAAQAGAALAITHPGATLDAVDQVIWWPLRMPRLPEAYPWSLSEINALAGIGVILPSLDDQLRWVALDWLKPVLAARKRLILVLPPPGEEVHPLWQMLNALIDKPSLLVLEQLMVDADPPGIPVSRRTSVIHRPLPPLERWWKLPDDIIIPMRKKESFSSLELMLFSPYQWVLRYPARLSAPQPLTLAGDFRLLGTLAHSVAEQIFTRENALHEDLDAWFEEHFQRIIDEEGATFNMRGKSGDLYRFRKNLLRAMKKLQEHLRAANVYTCEPERALAGSFADIRLGGSADLVVSDPTGKHVIIDMKWSGIKKYSHKLENHQHLQLALYAEMLMQERQIYPDSAYFILDVGKLLTADTNVLRDGRNIPADNGENTRQLFQRFLRTWAWRKEQLSQGIIEVGLEALADHPAKSYVDKPEPPADGLSLEYVNPDYNDYLSLAGWSL